MTYVFVLYFEEKITSSQSSTPTSSIGISKYYSLSIDGRDNVINDLVFSSSSISFKFKNSSNSNSNSNKNNGNKYEINTTDRYMIYDIIGELRNDGWLLLSVSSSNNGNKEKYLFEYNDNNDNNDNNDAINDTNDIKKTTNNKSVFHSIKTIFSTTKNNNSKHTNSNSSSNSNSNSKDTNSNSNSNSNNAKKHKNDNKEKGKQTLLSISLDDDINILRDQYNTSSIEHNIDLQTDYNEDKSVDDISNAPLSSNSTSSHSPNHQKRTTTFEPDISPISPRKKIQQQLHALASKGNPSPKTISTAAHPNRVVNSTKKPAVQTGSVSPQRTKPSNQTNQDITPTHASKNIANTRVQLRKSEKEPPLVLSELPKKKIYDLSVNLGSVSLQENFILKDKNGRDEHSRLDILWS